MPTQNAKPTPAPDVAEQKPEPPATYAVCVYTGEIEDKNALVHSFMILGKGLTAEEVTAGHYLKPEEMTAKNTISFWPNATVSKSMKGAMSRLSIGQVYRMKESEDRGWFTPTLQDNIEHWKNIPAAKEVINRWSLRSRADKGEIEAAKLLKANKEEERKRLFAALEPFREEIKKSLPGRRAAIIGMVINYLTS